jgi:hypothetical protein
VLVPQVSAVTPRSHSSDPPLAVISRIPPSSSKGDVNTTPPVELLASDVPSQGLKTPVPDPKLMVTGVACADMAARQRPITQGPAKKYFNCFLR